MWGIETMNTQMLSAKMKSVAWEFKQLNKQGYHPLTVGTQESQNVKKTLNMCG